MSKRGKYTQEDADRERLAHGPNRAQDMHPEDKADNAESRRYGEAHAVEFSYVHGKEMAALISTYADDLAARLLEDLRERFWGGVWKPRAARGNAAVAQSAEHEIRIASALAFASMSSVERGELVYKARRLIAALRGEMP